MNKVLLFAVTFFLLTGCESEEQKAKIASLESSLQQTKDDLSKTSSELEGALTEIDELNVKLTKENSKPNLPILDSVNIIMATGVLDSSSSPKNGLSIAQSRLSQLQKYGSLTSTKVPVPTKSQALRPIPLRAPVDDDEGDYDDDDDDDEGIGWSPFTVKVD